MSDWRKAKQWWWVLLYFSPWLACPSVTGRRHHRLSDALFSLPWSGATVCSVPSWFSHKICLHCTFGAGGRVADGTHSHCVKLLPASQIPRLVDVCDEALWGCQWGRGQAEGRMQDTVGVNALVLWLLAPTVPLKCMSSSQIRYIYLYAYIDICVCI